MLKYFMVILHFIGEGISLNSKGFNYDARSKVVYNGIDMSHTKKKLLVRAYKTVENEKPSFY